MKFTKTSQKIVLIFAIILAFILTLGTSFSDVVLKDHEKNNSEYDADNANIPLSEIQRFATVIAQVRRYYIKPVEYKVLFDNAIRGMLMELDPHSSYLDEQELKDLQTATTGEFGGLGVEVMPENGLIRIISPIDGTPAKKAGIRAGDLILKVNDKLVKKMTTNEAILLMRGDKGTRVTLTILRKGNNKPLKIVVQRDVIKIETIKSHVLAHDYGYIRIALFHDPSKKDLLAAIASLSKKTAGHLRGVIIDLRNNPGGLLDAAVDIADTFLDAPLHQYSDNIVYTKGRIKSGDVSFKATKGDVLNGLPLVVLINAGSASASEVVAGALQDYKRAVIVGTKSFGKGSVQTVLPIGQLSAIKLTTALYYTPAGRSIQAKGIEPDIVIPYIELPKLTNHDGDTISIDESELEGHLANANAADTDTTSDKADKVDTKDKDASSDSDTRSQQPDTESATSDSLDSLLNSIENSQDPLALAKKDYQLFEALNILKGLNTLRH